MTVAMFVVGALFLCWIGVIVTLWLEPRLRLQGPGKKPRLHLQGPGKRVYLSGRPVEILPLQEFRIAVLDPRSGPDCLCSHCSWFLFGGQAGDPRCQRAIRARAFSQWSLTTDLYPLPLLEGFLLRGIVK